MGTTNRRQAGEGGISEYQSKAGPRFLISYPVLQEDGTKVVVKRGFKTRREAAAALRAEVRKTETGEWVHPSKQLLSAYLVKIVFERLGHASATITLTVYQHVHPGRGRQAADRFAALLDG